MNTKSVLGTADIDSEYIHVEAGVNSVTPKWDSEFIGSVTAWSRVGRRDVLYIISGILHTYVKYEYYIVYAI